MTQKSEDTPVNTDRLRVINPKHRMKDKMIHMREIQMKTLNIFYLIIY